MPDYSTFVSFPGIPETLVDAIRLANENTKKALRIPSPFMKIVCDGPNESGLVFHAEFYRYENPLPSDEVTVVQYQIRGPILQDTNLFVDGLQAWVEDHFVQEFKHWQDEQDANWIKRGNCSIYYPPLKAKSCQT